MSTLEVNKITPISGGTTVTLGNSGDTFNLASGATAGFGKIGQVKAATYGTEKTSTTTTYADTGLSLSITPSSTSSKILVLVSQNLVIYDGVSSNTLGKIQLLRDSTQINQVQGLANRYPATHFSSSQTSIYKLDSPATTSSVTYKTQFAIQAGSEVRVQYGSINDSFITLMEVLA